MWPLGRHRLSLPRDVSVAEIMGEKRHIRQRLCRLDPSKCSVHTEAAVVATRSAKIPTWASPCTAHVIYGSYTTRLMSTLLNLLNPAEKCLHSTHVRLVRENSLSAILVCACATKTWRGSNCLGSIGRHNGQLQYVGALVQLLQPPY